MALRRLFSKSKTHFPPKHQQLSLCCLVWENPPPACLWYLGSQVGGEEQSQENTKLSECCLCDCVVNSLLMDWLVLERIWRQLKTEIQILETNNLKVSNLNLLLTWKRTPCGLFEVNIKTLLGSQTNKWQKQWRRETAATYWRGGAAEGGEPGGVWEETCRRNNNMSD